MYSIVVQLFYKNYTLDVIASGNMGNPRVHRIPRGPRIYAVGFSRPRFFGTTKDDAKMRRLTKTVAALHTYYH